MADELNGRDGPGAGRAALRISFAPASQSEADEAPARAEIAAGGRLTIDGEASAAALTDRTPSSANLQTSDGIHRVLLHELPDPRRTALGVRRVEVVIDGWRFELDVESEARARLRERATSVRAEAGRGGPSELRAIIPGRVISVDVAEGDTVEPGGRLLVLEAMKMQNELKAPRAGTVVRVAVGPGETVELGDVLVVLE